MTGVIITIIVLVLVLAVIAVVMMQMRRKRLQERFGPEYDRAVAEGDSRRAAEHDLAAREKRVRQLEIRPLAPEARERYATQWTQVQSDFVDSPNTAVGSAQSLVTEVMRERGYPTDDPEQRMEDLSVEHADVMDHYRQAHEISSRTSDGQVSTEELRQGMVHYRSLFDSLLGGVPRSDAAADLRTADPAEPRTTGTRPTDRTATDRLDADPPSMPEESIDVRDQQRTERNR